MLFLSIPFLALLTQQPKGGLKLVSALYNVKWIKNRAHAQKERVGEMPQTTVLPECETTTLTVWCHVA